MLCTLYNCKTETTHADKTSYLICTMYKVTTGKIFYWGIHSYIDITYLAIYKFYEAYGLRLNYKNIYNKILNINICLIIKSIKFYL